MKKILAIAIMCVGLLALVPNVESGESGIIKAINPVSVAEVLIDNSSDNGIIPLTSAQELKNISTKQTRYIANIPRLGYNSSEITKWEFYLYVSSVGNAGNISVHKLVALGGHNLAWETNWTDYKSGVAWVNPGGDFVVEPLDTVYINTTGYKTFNITSYLDASSTNFGLIFIAENETNITFNGMIESTDYSYWLLYYKGGLGQSTALIKNIWNLEGYVNAFPKLASTIYSEISNCTALSWKNATSGYWYTYWPSVGLLEDEYLQFGDGLFILVDTNTTWDHT